VIPDISNSSADGRGQFDLAIVHRPMIQAGQETKVFTAIRRYVDPIAVAADVPNLQEFLELSRFRVEAYCNSYMADVHYRQMSSMLAGGMTWFHPPILLQTLEMARLRLEGERSARSAALDELTRREQEIASDVAAGLSNREIAEERRIAERTVKAHLTRIFKKLGTRNRHALTVRLRGF
jgi:DNA-binding NarL/FixJ family response regulator